MLALRPLLLGFTSACRGSVVPLLFLFLVGSVAWGHGWCEGAGSGGVGLGVWGAGGGGLVGLG